MTHPRQDKNAKGRRSGEGQEPLTQPEPSQRRGAKTEAIRMAMAEHPEWGAKQIHKEINSRGIRVSIQMIYKVMEAVESLTTAATEPVNIEALNLQELMEFKVRIVDPYGGLARVEALVMALKKLQCPPNESGNQKTQQQGEEEREMPQ